MEQVRRVLNILHARLPVEHEQVDAAHRNVAQPAARRRVPEDAGNTGALLELAPPGVAVHALVVRLFQHHRQNVGEEPRRLLVVLRPRQHVRLRVVVHGVGVFVGDGVEQPAAGRLGFALHHGVLVVLPVSHPEPQFVVHQPLVQRSLARLVLLQDGRRLRDLLRADGQFPQLCIVQNLIFHRFSFPSASLPSPSKPNGFASSPKVGAFIRFLKIHLFAQSSPSGS